jgi:hypothetical protein
MSTVINFTKDNFPSLSFTEFLGPWNQVALEDLSTNEQEFMSVFLSYAAGDDAEPNVEDILLVKAAAGGILKDVYGPSLFQGGDGELILKVGANSFPVKHVGGLEWRVGGLEGQISFESKPIKVKQKDSSGSGEEYEVELYPANLELLPDDGSEWQFNCRCSWDISADPTPAKVKQTMKRGESIAHFFRTVPQPGEGGDTFKMQDLGEGEFAVVSIRVIETKNYGDRYVLKLSDDREVWSRGNVEAVLKDDECRSNVEDALKKERPVTLCITSITQRGDRTYVDCALRFRAPRAAGEVVADKPKAAKTVNQQKAAAKSVAPAGATSKVAVGKVEDKDIPF